MFLLRGFISFAYCDRKHDHLDYIQKTITSYIDRLKEQYGTQIMSYPNPHYQVKGNLYSVTFDIDKRKGTLQTVMNFLENNLEDKNLRLINKEKKPVGNLECLRFDYTDNSSDFTITLVGPNNNHFYIFEYTKQQDFSKDFDRITNIYEKANREPDPNISRMRQPQILMANPKPYQNPEQNLEALGARIFKPDKGFLEWDYLAGYEETKREIEDTILLTLEHPEIYDKIADVTRVKSEANRPRAVLFEGPPGTGKTTSAKIIAHQVKIPMVYVRVETIVSMYYGEAEKNLGKIFDNCKQIGKCIIFIDEIDSLAQSRERNMHEATRRILSVFLRYLDGFEASEDIIIICATNRKTDLDPALQSRFSKVINFPFPDTHARAAIYKRYARHLSDIQIRQLAETSEGLTGRDIKNICEDAERQWAARVLRGEVSHYNVDFSHYLHALRSRHSAFESKKLQALN
jgi:SpoVK/Ycf46/Vps4 family AAA+-type ATPase